MMIMLLIYDDDSYRHHGTAQTRVMRMMKMVFLPYQRPHISTYHCHLLCDAYISFVCLLRIREHASHGAVASRELLQRCWSDDHDGHRGHDDRRNCLCSHICNSLFVHVRICLCALPKRMYTLACVYLTSSSLPSSYLE